MNQEIFPALPLSEWQPTKKTLHLYSQIVGKIRLKLFPRINHWWHVPLYVSPRGITTRPIPYNNGSFEIEFDFRDHKLRITCDSGNGRDFSLYDGMTVAYFYRQVFENLKALGIEVKIWAVPYEVAAPKFEEDTENKFYDKIYVERFHRILINVDNIFEEFRGRFTGKSTPVHLFWHSFDLALTRFSGRPAKIREGAGLVEAEAYSHEVISFGFWAGDDKVAGPAFYAYAAPEPAGLADEKLQPDTAKWNEANGSHLGVLMYDDIREKENARELVLEFLESAYQAGAKLANWDVESFKLRNLK